MQRGMRSPTRTGDHGYDIGCQLEKHHQHSIKDHGVRTTSLRGRIASTGLPDEPLASCRCSASSRQLSQRDQRLARYRPEAVHRKHSIASWTINAREPGRDPHSEATSRQSGLSGRASDIWELCPTPDEAHWHLSSVATRLSSSKV